MEKYAPVTVIEAQWKSGVTCVGIILIRRSGGSFCAFIGGTTGVLGADADARFIADFGARLSFQEAHGFFPAIKEEEYQMRDDF